MRGRTGRTETRPGSLVAPLLAVLAVTAAPAVGWAQSTAAGASSGIEYQYIDFTDPAQSRLQSVSLLTMPLSGRAVVAEDLRLQIGSTLAWGDAVRLDGSESSVSGITDTDVSLSYTFGRDVLTVTAIGRLPTGKSEYTSQELDVAGVLASDLFPFRLSNWGTGGGAGFQATTTGSVGETRTALSVGYFRSGEFDPIEGRVTAYRPGDNLNARGALNVPTGEAGHLDLQLALQWFGDDQLQEATVFSAGNRYEAVARYTYPVTGRSAVYLYSGYQNRAEGTRLQLNQPTASQDLVLLGTGARIRLEDGLVLRPRLDTRILNRGDDTSEGYDVRAGTRLEWATGGLILGSMVRGHLGRLTVREGLESGFFGFDLGFTVGFGRGVR